MSEIKTDKISSVSTNGDITLDPDGTGDTNVDNGDFLFLEEAASSPYPEQKIKWSNDSTTANGFYLSQDTGRNGRVWHEQGLDVLFGTNNAERMRIESGGDVKIGSHYEFRSNGDFVVPASGFSQSANSKQLAAAIIYSSRDSTSSSAHLAFYNSNGEVGTIRTSGSATAYNTSSDHRLKENVADMTGAIARVKQLAPKRFNFIADTTNTLVDGFLAHEAQTVVPEAVHGTHNEVDDDGNAVMQGIDQSKLVPLLVGALKESITKIETLETEMTALKARVTALENV